MNLNRPGKCRILHQTATKSELERLHRRQQEMGSGKERKARITIEPLIARSIPETKMEVDELSRSSGRFYLERVAQEQMNDDLETWTPPEPTHSKRDL